ncbi:hypothetical protein [Streptomyces alanosinicus]|uniref:Uncharacterized protein n=1 Tax=Streptomyces alanosinicus TaxID=68171 RepID=A0A918IR63_9ACTN|nr:hypothetical protein [Streptomyces alanosinicus]GGW24165.1 hypothetical protein GCM10010339_93950 [Streptomyces alanosinicus]
MQWTTGNGGAYGEDPYDGAGYAYAYGREGYGHSGYGREGYGHSGYGGEGYGHEAYGGDTATLAWDPAQPAQWAQPHPTAWDGAGGPAWDAGHGDVLTMPAPETDTQPIPFVPGPEPESEPDPDTLEGEPAGPVFVDVSGRRQRRVMRAARLLMIPAAGYVALLISTVLGGPGVSAPFVPQPDSAHRAPPRVTASDSPPAPGHSAGRAGSAAGHADSRPTAQRTSPPVRPTASTAPATSAPPTRATSPTATASPTPTSSSRGRALGTSHKPVK